MLVYIEYVKGQIEQRIEEYKAKLDLSTENQKIIENIANQFYKDLKF